MSELEKFKSEVFGFQKAFGISDRSFGIDALNDPMFINRLRKGRDPSLTTAERVRNFMKGKAKEV